MLEPGDTQFANNHLALHSRTGFEDHEDETQTAAAVAEDAKFPQTAAGLSGSQRVRYSARSVCLNKKGRLSGRPLCTQIEAGQSLRSTIIFLISPIAFAGFRPLGQVFVQFMIV